MENKVLIKLMVPELEKSFDVFLPVGEVMWRIKKMLLKSISDLTGAGIDSSTPCVLINKATNSIYKNNQIVIDTDIRNASELILILKK